MPSAFILPLVYWFLDDEFQRYVHITYPISTTVDARHTALWTLWKTIISCMNKLWLQFSFGQCSDFSSDYLSSCDILEHLYQCCMEPSLPWRSYMYGIIIIIIIQCREIVQTEYFFYIALTNSPAMIWQHELPTGVVCRVQHVYSSGITTLTFKSSNWYSKRWRQQNILPHILYPIYVNSDSETL